VPRSTVRDFRGASESTSNGPPPTTSLTCERRIASATSQIDVETIGGGIRPLLRAHPATQYHEADYGPVYSLDMKPFDLPVVGAPTERADAARNRQRILVAAETLFARDGVACTSMDAIAAEAKVGKGTLFRRFGDRASLALAVLEPSERAFQDAFIRGPAPLGPGAPARDRLIAFGRGLLEQIAAHGDLLLAAQTARTKSSRFESGPYRAYRAHISMLIRDAAPDLDADYTADALLALLGAEVVLHQLDQPGMNVDRLASGWETIVHRLVNHRTRES
jgi:AcrR family transcriptional regulator